VSKKAVPQVCHPSHIYHLRLTIEYVDGYKDRGAHGYEGRPGVSYPALVSNVKGLENLLQPHHLLAPSQPIVSEIAVFTAASDSFNQANTNKTAAESLIELEKVIRLAKEKGLICQCGGYLSVRGEDRPEKSRGCREGFVADGMLGDEPRRYCWNGDRKNCESVDE